jgi:hypothetical protein
MVVDSIYEAHEQLYFFGLIQDLRRHQAPQHLQDHQYHRRILGDGPSSALKVAFKPLVG